MASNAEVFSITKHSGFVRSLDYFDRRVFSRDIANYKLVRRNDLAYATIHLDEGAMGLFAEGAAGLISPMYTVIEVTDKTVDPSLLFRLLKRPAMIDEIARLGNGSVHRRRSISFNSLANLQICLPPPNEQRAIATILDAIDDAIERTEAVIATSEVLRQALLHELLTRGLPGWHRNWTSSPSLGPFPACWNVTTVESVLREPIRNGLSMVAPAAETGRWQFTLGAVTFGGLDPSAIKPAPDNAQTSASLQSGDLLVSRSNTRDRVGLAGVYRGDPDGCTYPDLLMRVRLDTRLILPEFAEAILLSPRGRDYFARAAGGTSGSMVKITGRVLAAFPLALPSLDEQRHIIDVTTTVVDTNRATAAMLVALRALRDAAAEALLTGRLRAAKLRPAVATVRQ